MQVGFLCFDIQNQTAKIFDDGETTFSSTNLATVGEAVAKTLLPEHIEETKNQHVFVSSHNTTQAS